MKKSIIIAILALICLVPAFCLAPQSSLNSVRGFSIGTGLIEASGDFGLTLHISSPWFFNGSVAVKATGMFMYDTSENWNPFWGVKIGVSSGSFMQSAAIRLYGEGGMLCVFPPSVQGSQTILIGGYGQFGFEFFIGESPWSPSYFLEFGGSGVVKASETSEQFLTGFTTTVGLRWTQRC